MPKKRTKNGMIQIAYLKGVIYYEYQHYHYTYIGRTKNNCSMKNLNQA